ncbi:MAG: 3-deoxy-8-phosphooctulonate synthase [Limnospira sp. PMC 1234.20]|uniref:3-deoxy-8-phosphooctulonate synthase n=1 Tax=Limnospira sp. PMC 1234.20 TaxID=2981032 RepID=UPI0028E176A8|nr:3-deoxy-8-phosphooctulonate synthase [Limnospira sp. PMC 1234.20]MDT9270903.1 3-deoxy-8-phosphooctulonate synthase [Limnospira sp. PMC 1234.20]
MNFFDNLSDSLFFICGPCAIESRGFALETAAELKKIFSQVGLPFIYKSSFDKANRTSMSTFRGVGLNEGLSILAEVRSQLNIPVLTDVHETWQVKQVAEAVDMLQVPAFLCRQTDLIREVAQTGKPVNVKKGQFLAPWDMKNVMDKARQAAQEKDLRDDLFFACERGTTFGYGNLVVDMRGLQIMKETCGSRIIFDATHSVQLPGGQGTSSGGQRQYVPHLARAAVATGAVSGLFMEAHPNPDDAPSDGPNMLTFKQLPGLLRQLQSIYDLVKNS